MNGFKDEVGASANDGIFDTSSTQQPNANVNIGNIDMPGDQFDQGLDRTSGSNNPEDVFDDDQARIGLKRKGYQRHTPRQVQEMKRFFNECPQPDEEQREQLASMLGMEPYQVKVWFQNKRAQFKAQQERAENHNLRHENEKLKSEQLIMQEPLHKTVSCVRCGAGCRLDVEEILERTENKRLREELSRLYALYSKFCPDKAGREAEILFNRAISNQEARMSLMRVAARLVRSYFQGVSSTIASTWTHVTGSGDGDVRILSRKSFGEVGMPWGVILCGSTSFSIPVAAKEIHNYLCNVPNRDQWDIRCYGGHMEEVVRHETGIDAKDCISVFRVSGTSDVIRENMLILQKTSISPLGAYVIYAPMHVNQVSEVLSRKDSDHIVILPCGIFIMPDYTNGLAGTSRDDTKVAGGSVLRVAFQILIDADPDARITLASINAINSLVTHTADKVKSYVNDAYVAQNNANGAIQIQG